MDKVKSLFTVYFENPFWVGVYERTVKNKLEAGKIVFGEEPKDYEVYEMLLTQMERINFSPTVTAHAEKERKINPKRLQKEAAKSIQNRGIGTKAQQALKLQQENNKQERKAYYKKKTEEEKERLFEIKQQKRKEKHRGH